MDHSLYNAVFTAAHQENPPSHDPYPTHTSPQLHAPRPRNFIPPPASKNKSFAIPVTPDPTPKVRPIIPESEFRPIVRQSIVAPIPTPRQLIIPRLPRPASRALQLQHQLVHVFRIRLVCVRAVGLDVYHTLRLGVLARFCIGGVGVTAELPSSAQGMVHDRARQAACVARVKVFGREVVDDVGGLGGGEERGAAAVAEEAEVAVVGYDQDGGVPGCLRRGGRARANVVHRADVAAVETEAGAGLEHLPVGGVGGC